jgi:hypothetical protein
MRNVWSRIAGIALLAASVTACDDIAGPLFAVDVRLIGPEYVYGEISRSGNLQCSFVLIARTSSGGRDAWQEVMQWSGGVAEFRDRQAGTVRRESLSREWVEYYFGRGMRADSEQGSRLFVLAGDNGGEWDVKLSLTYFDTGNGWTREATHHSQCRR